MLLPVLLAPACQSAPAGQTSFVGSAPPPTTAEGDSTEPGSTGSTGSTSSTGTTGDAVSGGDATSEPARDLPAPDFGDGTPAGCRGKIDFLFVISRVGWMWVEQDQLAAAFPAFIATIESKFADFDYHIMVIDGDGETLGEWGWGDYACGAACPDLATCKRGDPCCPDEDPKGYPCCETLDYPCDLLEQVSQCDWMWGAGSVFPAGNFAANHPCPIDGGRRYLRKGQTDLAGTFACIASVGTSGRGALGQAMTAALQPEMNAPGGCNKGFLRDDALLMVTFIDNGIDSKHWESEGYVFQWDEALRDAKHGDEHAIVLLATQNAPCDPHDRICQLVEMFPHHHHAGSQPDYGLAFATAAELVDTACAGFVPPG
jgi:hypothetical protein